MSKPTTFYECDNEDCRFCEYITEFYIDFSGCTRFHKRDEFREERDKEP